MTFRTAIAVALTLAASGSAIAQGSTWVDGYTRSDGTYVQGHYRSKPNQYRFDNRNSQTNGGYQRDEFSNPGATNRSNPAWGSYDNDADGLSNAYDYDW